MGLQKKLEALQYIVLLKKFLYSLNITNFILFWTHQTLPNHNCICNKHQHPYQIQLANLLLQHHNVFPLYMESPIHHPGWNLPYQIKCICLYMVSYPKLRMGAPCTKTILRSWNLIWIILNITKTRMNITADPGLHTIFHNYLTHIKYNKLKIPSIWSRNPSKIHSKQKDDKLYHWTPKTF